MATLICMDGTKIHNYDRNKAAMSQHNTPTPHRDSAILRKYNEMCNEDITDHGELSLKSNFQTWEWLDIAHKLHEVSRRVAPGFVVYVSDRARDAESRARTLLQAIAGE